MSKAKARKPRADLRLEVNKAKKIELVDFGVMVEGWVHSVENGPDSINIEIYVSDIIWAKEKKNA